MADPSAILDAAQDFANSLGSTAGNYAQDALRRIAQVDLDTMDFVGISDPDIGVPDFSGFSQFNINYRQPERPQGMVPVFYDLHNIDISGAPENTFYPPKLESVQKPSALAEFTKKAPSVSIDAVIPDAPDYITAEHPLLGSYVTPEKPQYSFPSFVDGAQPVIPTFDTNAGTVIERSYKDVAPSFVANLNGYLDAAMSKYNPRYSEQMQAVENQLARYMQGGTALNPAVEDAIYSRARSKNDAEARRAHATAYSDAANRGFTLPNGALLSAITGVRQAAADNNAKAASEIAIAQAEMEQKNLQFAVTTSAGLRTAVLNSMLQYAQLLVTVNGQAIEYAKNVLSGIIETYNLSAKKVSLELDVLKANIAVYETRMKGTSLTIELYRSEIAALEAMVNVDRAKVDMYKSQIEASSIEMSAYKTKVDAIVSVATLKKLQMELFSSEVQAYGVQVQAKESEWRGYIAAIQGEESKIKLYQAQLDSLKTESDIYQAKIKAQSDVVQIQMNRNNSIAAQAQAIANVYKTDVQVADSALNADISRAKMQLDVSQATVKAEMDHASLSMQAATARLNYEAENIKLHQNLSAEELRANIEYMKTVAQVSSIGGNAYAGMAQAALSGINVLAASTETI